MPYIKFEARVSFEDALYELGKTNIVTPGELNYLFTKIMQQYVNAKGVNYTAINDVLGALEGAKLEFYRRVAIPYEETKIKENGDV